LLLGSQLAINPWLSTDVFEFPKLLVLIVGVGALTLVNIIDVARHGLSRITFRKIPREFFFLGLFLLAQILAYVLSTDRGVSLAGADMRFQGFLTQVHYILLALNTFYFFARSPAEKTRGIFNWLLITLFLVCALALLPYAFPMTFPFYIFTPAFFSDRVFATFGNPNYLAAFLITALPFLILSRWLRPGMARFAMTGFLALVLVTLFLTGSRSAWLASLVGFLFLGFFQYIKHKRAKILGVTLLVIVALGATATLKNYIAPIIPQFERISLDTERSISISTRLHLWQAGLQSFLTRPFTGFGQDMLRGNIEPYVPEHLKANEVFFIDRTHSELIDILLTTGIFGLIGYLGFFGLIFWKEVRSGLKETAALTALFTLFLFHAVNFSTISSNVMLYFLAGYLLVQHHFSRKSGPNSNY
jgi:O-antigen ligase